jgi:hypothetical protein
VFKGKKARRKLLREEGHNSGRCSTRSTGISKKVGLGRCVACNHASLHENAWLQKLGVFALVSTTTSKKEAGAGAERNNSGQMRAIVGQLIHPAR